LYLKVSMYAGVANVGLSIIIILMLSMFAAARWLDKVGSYNAMNHEYIQ
jgi:hypothetical protein